MEVPAPGVRDAYPIRDGKILAPTIEVIVVEHCNLGCRSCSHLSPAFPRRFVDPAAIRADLTRLASCFHADVARLLGGEPTLHPRLIELIEIIRASGVSDRVGIETNGTTLARLPEALWEGLDEVYVTSYPGHELTPELASACLRLADRHGVALTMVSAPVMRETHAALGTANDALVQRIFDTCKVAHEWRCHALVDGRLYKCPQACSIPRVLGPAPGSHADADGFDLSDPTALGERLLRYLESPDPLLSCRRCLGTVGKVFAYEEPPRESWTKPQERTSEELINWFLLERDEQALLLANQDETNRAAGERLAARQNAAGEVQPWREQAQAERAARELIQARLEAVLDSKSWRWSAPLRSTLKWLRGY